MAHPQLVPAGATVVALGHAGDFGHAACWQLQVSLPAAGAAVSFNIVPRGRVHGAGAAPASLPLDATSVPLGYRSVGATADTAGGTAITASGIYRIPCDGCAVVLDVTATGGAVVVTAQPVTA